MSKSSNREDAWRKKPNPNHQHPGQPFEIDQYYTLEEACSILDISLQTAKRYIKQGKLIARKIGGKVIVTKTELGEFIRSAPRVSWEDRG